MRLDIRWPIGLMFLSLGVVLVGYGLLSDPAIYAQSLNVNVNLIWGVVLMVFGLAMALLGRRGQAQQRKKQNDIHA